MNRSNTQVKISLSNRVKRKNINEPPESPLPVIKINDTHNAKIDEGQTDEKSMKSNEVPDSPTKDDNKPKIPKIFVNLKTKYDGFNRLRFIYPRIIPRLVEEKDMILPCQWKQVAHRCWVMVYWLLKKSVVCPYCDDFYMVNDSSQKVDFYHEDNRNSQIFLTIFLIFVGSLLAWILAAFAYFLIQAIFNEDKVRDSVLTLIFMILIAMNTYWIYSVILYVIKRKLRIFKISILSKDGYEPEITRLQSKRNLFKFIKTYFTKEINFVPHPEEFWWRK